MQLRRHDIKDIPLIKEWMNDTELVKQYLGSVKGGALTQIDELMAERSTYHSRHFAIVSDSDEYMGTVSLNHIINGTAELRIVVRKDAMRRGYSWFGIEEILRYAFEQLEIESVYWCVNKDNERAIKFCNKHNFHQVVDVPINALNRYEDPDELNWFSVLNGDDINIRESVVGCKVVHIKTISTIDAGELSFFEATQDIPFEIKRVYYISKVPEGVRRGFHAHKELKQLLFCPYGRIQLILENNNGREEIELSDPSIGVVIDQCTWREMLWLQKGSVLCVAASDFYKVEDYIRDYDEFKRQLYD